VRWGAVKSFDEAALRAMPRVIDVARIPTGVAIMAETFGQALDAQEAIKARYNKWETP
jgi:isoquinoline 1-oxidoreductase beta subunit